MYLRMSLMANILCTAAIGSWAAAADVPYAPGTGDYPEHLRREDSFFGIHFDFHAGPQDTEVSKNVTPEMAHAIIDMAKPVYIQVDRKGQVCHKSSNNRL